MNQNFMRKISIARTKFFEMLIIIYHLLFYTIAKVSTLTWAFSHCNSARAQASKVDPVVKTSSSNNKCLFLNRSTSFT